MVVRLLVDEAGDLLGSVRGALTVGVVTLDAILVVGRLLGRVLARTTNPVAVSGHLATGDGDPWTVSTARAQLSRALLQDAGVADARVNRVTGKADRGPVVDDPAAPRNRRIEITLLRSFPKVE